jgi:hypothetical protein
MDNASQNTFKGIIGTSTNDILDYINELNESLEACGERKFNGNKLDIDNTYCVASIAPIIKDYNEVKGQKVIETINLIINDAYKLSNASNNFLKDDIHIWDTSRNRERQVFNEQKDMDIEKRKTERADMWNLWLQKAIRWGLGAIFAILLYSTFVFVANNCDFIKIPIKDLIVPSQVN